MGIAHVTLQLRPWGKRRDAIDDDHVHRTAAYQVLNDLKRLFC